MTADASLEDLCRASAKKKGGGKGGGKGSKKKKAHATNFGDVGASDDEEMAAEETLTAAEVPKCGPCEVLD